MKSEGAATRFGRALDAVPDGIVLVEKDGRIALINREAERLFGYPHDDLLGQPIALLIAEPFPVLPSAGGALSGSDAPPGHGHERLARRKDGTTFSAEITVASVADGPRPLVIAAIRDVSRRSLVEKTQREAFEGELRKASSARSASAEMNERLIVTSLRDQELAASASEASDAKSRFLAAMSHEVRTPLNAIAGYVGLVEEGIAGPLTVAQRGYLQKVQEAIRHLVRVISDVLDLAKVDAAKMQVERRPGRLSDAVSEALDLVEPQASRARVALQRAGASQVIGYLGDPDRVRQILVNLLANAVKFTDSGGSVTVTIGETPVLGADAKVAGDGPWVFVAVADTGIGIAPEDTANVFQPFVRAQMGSAREPSGTGLGLTISRELARLMDGDITLRSVVGAGSCFTLWLPAGPAIEAVP